MQLINKTTPAMVAGLYARRLRFRGRGAGGLFNSAAGAPEVCLAINEKMSDSLRRCRVVLAVGVLGLILGGCGGGGGSAATRSVVTPTGDLMFPAIEQAVFDANRRGFEASSEYSVAYSVSFPDPDDSTVTLTRSGTDTHLARTMPRPLMRAVPPVQERALR